MSDEATKIALNFMSLMADMMNSQTKLLEEIRDGLDTLNQNLANQASSYQDDEPDMFATLNGPRNDMENPLKYGVKGEYGE